MVQHPTLKMRAAAAASVSALLFWALCILYAQADSSASFGLRLTLQEALAAVDSDADAVTGQLLYAQHHGLHKDHLCLTTSETCGFPIVRSKLTCCQEDSPYGRLHHKEEAILPALEASLSVGRCQLSPGTGYFTPSESARISANIYTLGGFLLHCELNSNADTCGPHDCGDLVITGQGEAYLAQFAVVEGPQPMGRGPFDSTGVKVTSCNNNNNNNNMNFTVFSGDEKDQSDEAFEKLMAFVGSALQETNTTESNIAPRAGSENRNAASDDVVNVAHMTYAFSGPVSITSKTHGTKWKEGWMEYTFFRSLQGYTPEQVSMMETNLNQGLQFPRIDSRDINTYQFQLFEIKEQY